MAGIIIKTLVGIKELRYKCLSSVNSYVFAYIKRFLHAVTIDDDVLKAQGYGIQGGADALVVGCLALAILEIEGCILQRITNNRSLVSH